MQSMKKENLKIFYMTFFVKCELKLINVHLLIIMTQLIACGVGQCGVQMAASFTDIYMQEAEKFIDPAARHRLFHETSSRKLVARTVLIDTEDKAVRKLIESKSRNSPWVYDPSSIWAEGCGSGNNWAFGYEQNGFHAKQDVLERLQHQAERCDRFGGFILFQSLGGGTGSGLGSRIAECIRDTFGPRAQIVNNVIWPYRSGDVIVQNYNAVFSLASLLKSSDAITVTHNDVLDEICAAQKGAENVTFEDMNAVFARNIAGVVLPSNEITQVPVWSQPLAHLVQMPTRRLLSIFSYPIEADASKGFARYPWSALVDNVISMSVTGNFVGRSIRDSNALLRNPALIRRADALWLILRGEETAVGRDHALQSRLLKSGHVFPAENDDPLLVSSSTRRFFGYDGYALAMANSSVICDPLDDLLGKFHNMYESSAFLHQFLDAGMERETIYENKCFLEQILHEYQTM